MEVKYTVEYLTQILYHSKNGAEQDDAAELLAVADDCSAAESALFHAIESTEIDDSLKRTCAESLVSIWIARGRVSHDYFDRLAGMPRDVVVAFLIATGNGSLLDSDSVL